jgi:hypothetical protein
MLTESEIDSLARKVASVLYVQLVDTAAASKTMEWSSDEYSAGADPQYLRIVAFFKTLNPVQRLSLGDAVHRTATDTLVQLLDLFSGAADVGLPGQFSLTYDGHDIGPYLKDHILALDDSAVNRPPR